MPYKNDYISNSSTCAYLKKEKKKKKYIDGLFRSHY